MFKKLESILSSRLSQFQPRSLLEVLHACIHLERFPLNYVSKVFSPFFLQRLRGDVSSACPRIDQMDVPSGGHGRKTNT